MRVSLPATAVLVAALALPSAVLPQTPAEAYGDYATILARYVDDGVVD